MSALVENPAGAGSQDIVRATGATHHPRAGDKATLESVPGTERWYTKVGRAQEGAFLCGRPGSFDGL